MIFTSQRYPETAGGVAQEVQHLHSKCEALSSNLSAAKKGKNLFFLKKYLELTNGLRKCGIYTQWNFMQP
jgi:hypothetical protein